jgi:AbiV family abortive infection protein
VEPQHTGHDGTQVIENAARLLSDAKLLADHSRFASAFALALLALEEVGRLILDAWEAEGPLAPARRRSKHLRKQAAVACLLLGGYCVKKLSGADLSGDPSEPLIAKLAEGMAADEAGLFFGAVVLGAVDKTKQLAFYRDAWFAKKELHPDQFCATDVETLFTHTRAAVHAIGDELVMRVGRAVYQAGVVRGL